MTMTATRKLWVFLISLLLVSFGVLLWVGGEIHRVMPPIPKAVLSQSGTVLYTHAEIEQGRQVWQSIGGHQLGSIWGHGSYVAPDWSADWLHREAIEWLNITARNETAHDYGDLPVDQQAGLQAHLQSMIRVNTYNADSDTITLTAERVAAIGTVARHYEALFGSDPKLLELRKAYAMKQGTVDTPEHRHALTAFIWWSAWAAVTERPGKAISYTNNWPHEPLVGNTPPPHLLMWTVFSVLFLIAGIALLGWHHARHKDGQPVELPKTDPLALVRVTPSMKATAKYFWLVIALFLTQILLGAITAHYQVEGQDAYGFALSNYLPYSLSRTWHTQLAVLWIATAWLGMGLYIGPAISGHEPKFQRLGVNVLWVCLLVIVVGAFTGQWFAVQQKLGLAHNFWWGHQGWEYVDLGRFWQLFLFVGLVLWLVLMGRALWPALRRKDDLASIVGLLFLSTTAIAAFYAAGLMWGEHTHLSVVEYWRWWVVHLWVEGFFEVFATVVIAFLFARLRVIRADHAAYAALLSGAIYLSGGIIGTLHHLYFAGTPTVALAFGSVFSALEIVPLVFVGYEALENIRHSKARPWLAQYKWVVYFFVAVAFWNLVGAGIFGFMINPPIALYYMQGLNTTAVHAHGALYGVYGTLGLAMLLFCMRAMKPEMKWNTKLLGFAFWAINIGMMMEILFSLLPIGLLQTYQSVNEGYWYARSPEFMQTSIMQNLRWMRMFGDTIFAIGAVAFVWFALGLMLKKRKA